MIHFGINISNTPTIIKIYMLGVNGNYTEYSPIKVKKYKWNFLKFNKKINIYKFWSLHVILKFSWLKLYLLIKKYNELKNKIKNYKNNNNNFSSLT